MASSQHGRRLGALVVLLTVLTCASQDCMFPKEMYGTLRHWRILSRDPDVGVSHILREVAFEVTDSFSVRYLDQYGQEGIVATEIATCLQALGENTYLIQRDLEGNVSYSCLQFVVRTPNVIQWRRSASSQERNPELCAQELLQLQDAPLLYYRTAGFWREDRNRGQSYTPCPLEGGYVLDWRHPHTGDPLCEDDVPPLKLESECERGEGIRFHVAHSRDNCQGRDYEVINAPYTCLASWTHKGDLYTVLVRPHDDLRYLLCLRVPEQRPEKFQGYLFLDSVCDSTDDFSHTTDYRLLTFRRHPVAGLCDDETPACDKFEDEDCDFPEAEVCRRACTVCEPGDIGQTGVEFPESFRGEWLKHTTRLGEEVIRIQERSFSIPSMSTYHILAECTDQRRISSAHRGNSYEYIMLSTYTNGCSPRMNTLLVAERDEAVLSFRLGPSQLATLGLGINDDLSWQVDNTLWGHKCRDMEYRADPDPLYDTYRPYQDGWFNLIDAGEYASTVDCEIPFNESLREVTFTTPSGVSCTGRIKDVFPASLRLDVDSCTYSVNLDTSSEHVSLAGQSFTFSCLTRFHSDPTALSPHERLFVVTKAHQDVSPTGHSHQCWLFMPERHMVYLMRASDCDVNTEHHVEASFKEPVAMLAFYENVAMGMSQCPFLHTFLSLFLVLLVYVM